MALLTEPVIQSMTLRIIKFLKEEYQTALMSARASQIPPGALDEFASSMNGIPQTPFSSAQSPYPVIPHDTSASFTTGVPHLSRQDTHFPFYTSNTPSRSASADELQTDSSKVGETSFDGPPASEQTVHDSQHQHQRSDTQASQSGIQPIGTSSIFELLGHDAESNRPHAASMSSSFYSSGTGHSTPIAHSEWHSPVIPSSPNADALHASLSRSQSKSHVAAVQRENFARFSTPSTSSLAPMAKRVLDAFDEDFSKKANDLKPLFTDAIGELADELGMVREQVAAQAVEHIHSA